MFQLSTLKGGLFSLVVWALGTTQMEKFVGYRV